MPRWFWGALGGGLYLEMLVIVALKIHLPVPPDPVFKKPEPVEYHWTRGPYDNDWDHCWQDYYGALICEEDQI